MGRVSELERKLNRVQDLENELAKLYEAFERLKKK